MLRVCIKYLLFIITIYFTSSFFFTVTNQEWSESTSDVLVRAALVTQHLNLIAVLHHNVLGNYTIKKNRISHSFNRFEGSRRYAGDVVGTNQNLRDGHYVCGVDKCDLGECFRVYYGKAIKTTTIWYKNQDWRSAGPANEQTARIVKLLHWFHNHSIP